jgi:hypothetical protein
VLLGQSLCNSKKGVLLGTWSFNMKKARFEPNTIVMSHRTLIYVTFEDDEKAKISGIQVAPQFIYNPAYTINSREK